MKGKDNRQQTPVASRARLRRAMEALATFGLILVAAGLVAPMSFTQSPAWMATFKWIYAAGALMYFGARLTASFGRDESMRVRRLRRMETWAGICFLVAGFFWFYNTANSLWMASPFKAMQETIVFTLAGAVIQVVASWMLSSAQQKELRQAAAERAKKNGADEPKK